MKRPGKMSYAPLYFEDFKKGCEDLSNEQIGAYLRVLFEIYEHMAPIDFDERRLAKRLNSRPHKARALVENLVEIGKLYLTREGQIGNHRAEDEILRFVSISVQNQLNATSNRQRVNSPGKTTSGISKPGQRPPGARAESPKNKNQRVSYTVAARSAGRAGAAGRECRAAAHARQETQPLTAIRGNDR